MAWRWPHAAIQEGLDELLGRGLPAPDDAFAAAGVGPDLPWSWCARCGGPLAGTRAGDGVGRRAGNCLPGRCRGRAPPGSPECVVRLGAHEGELRRWVVDVKHAVWEAMAERLARLLAVQLERCGVAAPGDPGTVVVPVPMPWLRARSRGIDHAACLANGVARGLRLPCVRPLCQRLAGTQVDRDGRASRAGSAGRIRRSVRSSRAAVAGMHVVLVDDVRTTGATLAEAATVLRKSGAARVSGAVVSVAE